MEFFLSNWSLWVGGICLGIACGISFYRFFTQPKEEQIRNVKKWLLYAVSQAEKELGSGTGVLKLRKVYDAFLVRFPKLANIITFEAFSKMVDNALDEMENIIDSIPEVKAYIQNEEVK